MDGLPPLRTEGPNIGNALLAGEEIQAGRERRALARSRNALLERQFGQREKEFEAEQEWREVQKLFSTLNAAMSAKTQKQAKQILEMGLGEKGKDFDVSRAGDKVTLTLPDGSKIEGPEGIMKEFSTVIEKNPQIMSNPEDSAHLIAWAAARGITVTAPQPFTLGSGMGRYSGTGKLIVERESETEKEKVPDKVVRAQQGLLNLAKSKEVNPVVAMMLAMNPKMATDPEIKKQLTAALPDKSMQPLVDKWLQIVSEYYEVPSKEPRAGGLGTGGPGVTHVFDPVEGLKTVP